VTDLNAVPVEVFAAQTDQPEGVAMSAIDAAAPVIVTNSSKLGSVTPDAGLAREPVPVEFALGEPLAVGVPNGWMPHEDCTVAVRAMAEPDETPTTPAEVTATARETDDPLESPTCPAAETVAASGTLASVLSATVPAEATVAVSETLEPVEVPTTPAEDTATARASAAPATAPTTPSEVTASVRAIELREAGRSAEVIAIPRDAVDVAWVRTGVKAPEDHA
jgi:hypothetical protein